MDHRILITEGVAAMQHSQIVARPQLRLAVFDLDGTLKEASSPWMYLHHALGTEEKAEKYRQQFYAGQITYLDWARLDSALWKGVELARVEAIFRDSVYRPGVHELFQFLQRHGVLTAIISTGLGVQARQVAAELGVWRTIANELVIQDGRLAGETVVNVEEHTKGQLMAQLHQEAGVRSEECLAVGDGTADIDLFAQAGLAIAVCPRHDRVRQAAHHVIEDGDLSRIIPLLETHFSQREPS
jgi:phosphoserine phosphatase